MIDEFISYLVIEKNFSDNTVATYKKALLIYEDFLEVQNLKFNTISSKELKLYISELYSLHYSKQSISLHISVLKSYYKFLYKKYKIENPTEMLVYPKLDKKLPNFLFFSEMDELLDLLEEKDIRSYLIFLFIYATGVRVSELTNVRLIDIYDNTLRVIGKGNKERIIPLSPYVSIKVEQYILERDFKSEFLFINNRGKQLTPRGISFIMNKELESLALNYKVTPHTLRHTFASHLLSNGMDIKVVQEILGHSSLQTTQVYTHITKSELIDTYNLVSQRNENE